jgi:Na+-driven multidrug efflux pump
MVITLTLWLPKWGILGAALASIIGYSVMFVTALFWLLRQQKISLWECLHPRWDDVPPSFTPAAIRSQVLTFLNRTQPADSKTAERLVTSVE